MVRPHDRLPGRDDEPALLASFSSKGIVEHSPACTRRQFLKGLALGGGCLLALPLLGRRALAAHLKDSQAAGHEALHYAKLSGLDVQCLLCFRECVIGDGARGVCGGRENSRGTLFSLTYAKPVAIHIDPIEKLPLFHFLPGIDSLCGGTTTCNFNCDYCINWEIALQEPEDVEAIPKTSQEFTELAIGERLPAICFTYNEPTQHFEYVLDTTRLAREVGLRTGIHSNGAMKQAPLEELVPSLDAAAIDLKAFSESFYRDTAGAELAPVLESLRTLAASRTWLEVVNLVVPTLNDDEALVRSLSRWCYENLGPDVPIHFDRFFPSNRLTRLPPTPVATLERAHDIALEEGMRFAYVGNVAGHRYGHTYCPTCGELLIKREQYFVSRIGLKEGGTCMFCSEIIPGVWR